MHPKRAKLERYVDEKHGFALFKPPSPFKFAPAKGALRPDTPALRVASSKQKVELAVILGPELAPEAQEAMTSKMAAQLASSVGGKSGTLRRMPRPDKRLCFRMPYVSKKANGVVVSVAGEGRTYVVVSSFPAKSRSAAVQDALFMQLALMVLGKKRSWA
ncbi:MAG: hypothetical protein HYZ28_11520 [Myxococcales bacterium]|nr:hypothetical protein [Myxococcales bacterium]